MSSSREQASYIQLRRDADVQQDISLKLYDIKGNCSQLEATFLFSKKDPYSVTICFHSSNGVVIWQFGRDLLIEGCRKKTGDGDVYIYPSRSEVHMTLKSPDGTSRVIASGYDINRFVNRMTRVVPPGTESSHVNVDHAIASIFSTEAP